jgi:hypothetical protein
MNTDAASHLTVNRNIRRVLVSHWVDLGRVSVHTTKNAVHIRGSLNKLVGTNAELTPVLVGLMHREIKNAAGDRYVHMEFDNWFFDGSANSWTPASGRNRRSDSAAKGDQTKGGAEAFELSE